MTKKQKPEEEPLVDEHGNVLIFDSDRCTREQWQKILAVSLTHNNADLFVDLVILGMERGFINEKAAMRLLTSVEEFAPKRIH